MVNYDFMYFHSLDQLENNFWESFLYTHSLNPAMNVLAAFNLRLPDIFQIPFYVFIFLALSMLLLLSMGKILHKMNIKDNIIFYFLAFFSITPAFIYFETFLVYTLPSASLLMLICYQFYLGITEDTLKRWLIFFSCVTLLSFVRSSFHLIWVVSILIGVLIIDFKNVKNKLIGFVIPCSTLFLSYFKNYLLFGFFGASSWGGFNFHFTTTARLTVDEKMQLVEEDILSPLVKVPIYSSIEAYAGIVDVSEKKGIAILDDVMKNERIPNYNHWKFIELSEMKMKDNIACLNFFPIRYIKTVISGLVDYHRPSTRWHPHDETYSPHIPNRKIIGIWENIYNGIIHFPFTKGAGIYLFMIPIVLYDMFRLSFKFLFQNMLSPEEKLLTFINWNIFFLMLVSCLITFGELERYRFITEGLIWVSVLMFLGQNISVLGKNIFRSNKIEHITHRVIKFD